MNLWLLFTLVALVAVAYLMTRWWRYGGGRQLLLSLPLQSWPDFRKWDQRNEFKLDEAAALWFNAEPRFPMWWRARWKLHQLRSLIAARADVAPRPAPAEFHRQSASAEVSSAVDRDTLKTLAQREGRQPLFLYPEFRFRSRDRDNGTDKGRIATIHECVLSAISSAESELDGLRGRLEHARQAATVFLANTTGQNDKDHPERTDQTSVEVRLLTSERRMDELRGHVAALRRIESAVNKELNA
jgi:hypothetical protein